MTALEQRATTARVRDRLARPAGDGFVGRTADLALLARSLEADGAPVTFVHGIGGIGKTRLLQVFGERARAEGVAVVALDCRCIEPTERGFLSAVGDAIGNMPATAEEAADRLAPGGGRAVLLLDHYELFRLLDTWLRQVFIPALPARARVVIAGRDAPGAQWLLDPAWDGLVAAVALGPLAEPEAATMLAGTGMTDGELQRINRFARGHPLALKLAAASAASHPDVDLETAAAQGVVEALTRLYVGEVRDPLTRQALNAASVVRRTSLSLLQAMLPGESAPEALARLRELPFVEVTRDGLHVHDLVQDAVAATLHAVDPAAHLEYRRAAWRQLRREVTEAGQQDLWRYTADLIYLLENPNVREAFFPTSAPPLTVEPAQPKDGDAIGAICRWHEGPEAARLLLDWWEAEPGAHHVVRDRQGEVAGFFSLFEPEAVNQQLLRRDPITAAWLGHLERAPVGPGERVLFCRRWLSREWGESQSPVQAATWLDIKRAYMALRPRLRRFYATANDLPGYAPALLELCFQPLEGLHVEMDGKTYHLAMNDFGPKSVDGWLARLVGRELGIGEESWWFDPEARELNVGECRVSLTSLEFGVMKLLHDRRGKAVDRVALLENVWGYNYDGGSNVVDVVVRSLRKKLGANAGAIETVRGTGYRLRQ